MQAGEPASTYLRAAGLGLLAGAGGALVMTVGEKLEQRVTGRPDSYVPSRTLGHLLGARDADADRTGRNLLMHVGTGVAVGALRGVWAAANLRGPRAALLFTPLRLGADQTLENATGVGAPPWTWPRQEVVVDVAHKAVYALATGVIADALVRPAPRSSARRRGLGLRLRGVA